jgi:hypothetical protein
MKETWTHRAALGALLCAAAIAVAPVCRSAESADSADSAALDEAQQNTAPSSGGASALIYDQDYPFIGYSNAPRHNDVAHLIAALQAGRMKLQYREPRGYLDSLLKALRINPDSQVLVFSKTSLQADIISPQTPRAIYFNDDTYVAWIEHTPMIEISTMDSMMGTVFYTLQERPTERPHFERETTRCLSCHDTFSLSGGGVPNFLFLTAYSRKGREIVTNQVALHASAATPMDARWGGWYVTGDLGGIEHLGNILPSPAGHVPLSAADPRNLANVDGLIDPDAYCSDKSDAVALLVLQHQVDIHNLIIHANFKSRMLMERHQPGSSTKPVSFEQLPPLMQRRFQGLLEPLVRGLLMVGAARWPAPIHGNSGFARSFEARGPHDREGRSLRELDLRTRLFKYPLSFLIYSEGFDYLPAPAKEYVYRRLDEILTGHDRSSTFNALSTADRTAIFEILSATKPDFARAVARDAAVRTASAASAPGQPIG